MKISVKQFQALKRIPNSVYDEIKPEFLFHSNKLEGSTFTEAELHKLVDDKTVSGEHPIDDVLETMNSVELFDFTVDTLREPLSDELLFEMNRILFSGTTEAENGFSGQYKKFANRIRSSRVQVALPSDIPRAMSELLPQMDEAASWKEIARLHARFEHIHPFQNGNGRIGRLLMLRQCSIANEDLIVIDSEYEQEYKTWLEVAQCEGDFRFYLDAIGKCMDRFDRKMESRGIALGVPSDDDITLHLPPSPAPCSKAPIPAHPHR